MNVALLEPGTAADAEWDAYVAGRPDSSIYHLSAWRRIFGDGLGYKSFLLLARDGSGQPRAALPLYRVSTPWRKRLVAVPFRDRGGPLWDDEGALAALLERVRELARQENAILVLKSIKPLPASAEGRGLNRTDHWIHSTLDLQGLDRDRLWQRVGTKRRNMVRQAEQQGVEVRRGTAEAGAAERWHALHLRTQKRLGVPPFPERFFSVMFDTLGARLELLEARANGASCAATLLFLHGTTCIYAYSASTEAGQRLRASDLLMHRALELALERGMHSFDFGSDSPLQENLLFFKRSWGASQAPIPLYASGPAGIRDSSDARYGLARAVLHRLPVGVLAAFGARVTRYFG